MVTIAKPVRKPNITVKDIGGEALLHSSEGEAIHVLNPTAQLIWQLCDGNHTLEEMEAAVRARFSVADEYDVAGDIRQTLQAFAAKQLLATLS
ncbi:MAG: PqqD family protein [Anaerolineae bacterium]